MRRPAHQPWFRTAAVIAAASLAVAAASLALAACGEDPNRIDDRATPCGGLTVAPEGTPASAAGTGTQVTTPVPADTAQPPRRADVTLTVDRTGNGFGETLVVTVTQVAGVPSGWLHLTVRSPGAVYLDRTMRLSDLTAPVSREWCLLSGPAEAVGATAVITVDGGVEVGRAFLALERRDGEIVTAPSLAELAGTASPGRPG